MRLRLTQSGLSLIARFEGFRANAYQDTGGTWTIGYGHTNGVRKGQRVTDARALTLLREDAAIAEKAVNQLVTVPINQHRFNALVSFVFNVGTGAFARSNLLRKLNAGDYPGVPDELLRWNKVNGHESAGLTNRRHAEAALWRRDV